MHFVFSTKEFGRETFGYPCIHAVECLIWHQRAMEAHRIELAVQFGDEETKKSYEWSVRLTREGYDFVVEEQVDWHISQVPPMRLLEADRGVGWWWSGDRDQQVKLQQDPTECALASRRGGRVFSRQGHS